MDLSAARAKSTVIPTLASIARAVVRHLERGEQCGIP